MAEEEGQALWLQLQGLISQRLLKLGADEQKFVKRCQELDAREAELQIREAQHAEQARQLETLLAELSRSTTRMTQLRDSLLHGLRTAYGERLQLESALAAARALPPPPSSNPHLYPPQQQQQRQQHGIPPPPHMSPALPQPMLGGSFIPPPLQQGQQQDGHAVSAAQHAVTSEADVSPHADVASCQLPHAHPPDVPGPSQLCFEDGASTLPQPTLPAALPCNFAVCGIAGSAEPHPLPTTSSYHPQHRQHQRELPAASHHVSQHNQQQQQQQDHDSEAVFQDNQHMQHPQRQHVQRAQHGQRKRRQQTQGLGQGEGAPNKRTGLSGKGREGRGQRPQQQQGLGGSGGGVWHPGRWKAQQAQQQPCSEDSDSDAGVGLEAAIRMLQAEAGTSMHSQHGTASTVRADAQNAQHGQRAQQQPQQDENGGGGLEGPGGQHAKCAQQQRQRAKLALQADDPHLLELLMQHNIDADIGIVGEDDLEGQTVDRQSAPNNGSRNRLKQMQAILDHLLEASTAPGTQRQPFMAPPPFSLAGGDAQVIERLYCLEALEGLIEKAAAYSRVGNPVKWGWCRPLHAFLFVFEPCNCLVLETPRYGHATWFFELEEPMTVEDQVRRLIVVLSVRGVTKAALLDQAGQQAQQGCLEMLGAEAASLLEACGLSAAGGLCSLVNFSGRRLMHDHQQQQPAGGKGLDWRERVGRELASCARAGRIHKDWTQPLTGLP